ncbi:sigma 54-interacting transcriptional regulator [Clostridium sp. PL3]|uniref:Sigma 54-interacting transcriptional regulator n=1 Tax=Clostridium thailandense TaxID=2794346 RepID=A0A949TY07_9CLOT|nr:sigma 54-interacting transcriptional regulator [Clostridium thailandense]MBV7272579.1 sigma 54-interacting transcriptional regulator [Clostridium thailandense]
MSSILLISPYAKLSKISKKIIESENIDMEIIEPDLWNLKNESSIKKINKDAKVILSRGMIARVVRSNTSVPVIEISVTSFDILDAISTVSNKGYKNIAIITVSNMLFNPEYEKLIGDMTFHFIACESLEESFSLSRKAVKSGKYDAIIGDALATMIAEENGVYGVLLESNERSIKFAIDEALKIVKHFKKEQEIQIKSRRKISEMGWIAKYSFNDILGESDEIKYSINLAKKFAKSDGNVLIYGETGTGKELFAQSIHNQSNRLNEPFISVNCGALSENLLESELFGYETGAFTGAVNKGKKGLFECANKGTIFLDEISETSLNFQAKLLRVLQERTIRKIGGQRLEDIDIRVICATNKNLLELVKKGSFREDVFYRLSQLELQIAPLCERKRDILIIAERFFKKELERQNKIVHWENSNIFEPLLEYEWPGNVRELRNFILKLVIFCEIPNITQEYIKNFFNISLVNYKKVKQINNFSFPSNDEKNRNAENSEPLKVVSRTDKEIRIDISKDFGLMESEMFKQLLKYYQGNKEKLCKDYGISRTTLWRKLNYK